jgi:hypothetical protein
MPPRGSGSALRILTLRAPGTEARAAPSGSTASLIPEDTRALLQTERRVAAAAPFD